MSSSPSSPTSDYGSVSNQRGAALVAPPKRVHHARRFRPTSTGSNAGYVGGGGSIVSGMSGSPSSYDDTSSMSTLLAQPTDTTSLLGGGSRFSPPPSAGVTAAGGGQQQGIGGFNSSSSPRTDATTGPSPFTSATQSSVMLMDQPHGLGGGPGVDDRRSHLKRPVSALSTPPGSTSTLSFNNGGGGAAVNGSQPLSTQFLPSSTTTSVTHHAIPRPGSQFATTTTTVVGHSANSRTSAFSPSTRVSRASLANSTPGVSALNPLRAARQDVRAMQAEEEERYQPSSMTWQLILGSILYIAGYALMKLSYTRWGETAEVQRLTQGVYVNPLYKWIVVALVTTILSLLITFLCICLMSARRAYFLGTRVTMTYGLPSGVLMGLYMTIQYLPGGVSYAWADLSFQISALRIFVILAVGCICFCTHKEYYNKTTYKPLLALSCVIPLLTACVAQIMGDHRQLDHWDQLVAPLDESTKTDTRKWLWFALYGLAYICLAGSLAVINAFLKKTTARCEHDELTNEAVSTLGYQAVAMSYLLGGGAHSSRRRRPLDQRMEESTEPFFPKSNWIVTVAAFSGCYAFFFGWTLIATTLLWKVKFFAGDYFVAPTVSAAYDSLLNGGGCLTSQFQGRDFCADFVNYIFVVACAGLLQVVGTVMVCLASPVLNVYNLLITIPLTAILSRNWSLWHSSLDGSGSAGSSTAAPNSDFLSSSSFPSPTGLNFRRFSEFGGLDGNPSDLSTPIDYGYEGPALAFCVLATLMHFYWQYKMTKTEEGPAPDTLSPLEGIGAQIDGARPQDTVPQP